VQQYAPKFSSWVVITERKNGSPSGAVKDPGTGNSENTSSAARKPSASRTTIQVTKTGDFRLIETTNGTGHSEVWSNGAWQVTKRPEWKELVVSNGENSADTAWVNYSSGDFPGFQWITAENFLGLFKFKGRDCLVFKDRVQKQSPVQMRQFYDPNAPTPPPVDPETLKEDVIAYVDLETRLPVVLIAGEQMSTYAFGEPPTEQLVFPPDVKVALAASMQKVQAMLARPSRP
jgi:hypothetical protein